MDYQQRRTAIRSALRIPPAPKPVNSDRIDAITELMGQVEDPLTLIRLSGLFGRLAEQLLGGSCEDLAQSLGTDPASQITDLAGQIRETSDVVALVQLSRQFSFAAEQAL